MVIDPDLHVPLVALVYGYGAGVAATVALRLWVSVPAVVIATTPMIFAALLMPGRRIGAPRCSPRCSWSAVSCR
ncbi:hypothetical protein ACFSTI_05870 [Rhizorhabdus histidinilytica]